MIAQCVSEFMFFVSNKKHTHTHKQQAKETLKKTEKQKKPKKKKEIENVVAVNNTCGKSSETR